MFMVNLFLRVGDVSVSVEPSKEPTDAGSTIIYIIASSVGATVLFILLLVTVPILALIYLKGTIY